MLHNMLNQLKNGLIWRAIDIEMRKIAQKYAKIMTKLHFSNLRKRSRAAQVPIAGHMRPAGRVFETADLQGGE